MVNDATYHLRTSSRKLRQDSGKPTQAGKTIAPPKFETRSSNEYAVQFKVAPRRHRTRFAMMNTHTHTDCFMDEYHSSVPMPSPEN